MELELAPSSHSASDHATPRFFGHALHPVGHGLPFLRGYLGISPTLSTGVGTGSAATAPISLQPCNRHRQDIAGETLARLLCPCCHRFCFVMAFRTIAITGQITIIPKPELRGPCADSLTITTIWGDQPAVRSLKFAESYIYTFRNKKWFRFH